MTPKEWGMKMSKQATEEYMLRMRNRYSCLTKKVAKTHLLDEFCNITGYDRKHAIKLLNGKSGNRTNKAGRKGKYDAAVQEVLLEIWKMSDQLCSKLLVAVIELYLESYKFNIAPVSEEVSRKMLQISPATIDRLLKPHRIDTAKWRRRLGKSSTKLKQAVPIRVGPWDVDRPGWLEADGVAHCGGSMAGNFIWSVSYTDIDSCWTEARATWNRSSDAVKSATEELRVKLPFNILGLDVDNGPEFLNWSLHKYCSENKLEFTRSRPYQKNDNAHIEQRNWTHVRQLLGYDRFEDPSMVDMINDVYKNEWSIFKNLYCPTMKLISKERIGSKYKKKFGKPQTPCQRLLASEHVSKKQKLWLRERLKNSDPYKLRKNMEVKLEKVFNHEQKTIQRRVS